MDTQIYEKKSIADARLQLFPTRMRGKQQLPNNYYFLVVPFAKQGLLKEKKQVILPNLTGWKLKNNGGFPLQVL